MGGGVIVIVAIQLYKSLLDELNLGDTVVDGVYDGLYDRFYVLLYWNFID